MHFFSKSSFFCVLNLTTLSHAWSVCKASISSSGWPTSQKWDALNAEVGGNLIHTVPPGASNASFYASNPVSVNYNDDTCYPLAQAPCSAAGYPAYVINASTAAHVQAGVNFARMNNVRLVVKGTGHDFNGRSNAPNSLSIWTHNTRGLQYLPSFIPSGCSGCAPATAVKVAAGMQMRDCYRFAYVNNVTFVGGADPNVGIGGWILGGGHSPISSAYGLGADNALEFTVVTAAGKVVVANQVQNTDLFWALRGGSAGFAVLLSVTVKVYPPIPVTEYVFSINTTARSDIYWSALTYFHTQLPRLSEGGLMGYYFAVPDIGSLRPDLASSNLGITYGSFLALAKSSSYLTTLLAPMGLKFANAKQELGGKVLFGGISTPYPDFNTYWFYNYPPGGVGFDGRLGSRLLSNDSLLGDVTKLNSALRNCTPISSTEILGHLVAGPGVRNAKPPGGNAVNPAWRKAYSHVKPHSGCYINEADPDEPHWQQAFWGSHYPRLLRIKRRWDPHGVFYCFPCVGAEAWTVSDAGVLCRAEGRK